MFCFNQVEGEGHLEVTQDGPVIRFLYWDADGDLAAEFQTESTLDIEGLCTAVMLAKQHKR